MFASTKAGYAGSYGPEPEMAATAIPGVYSYGPRNTTVLEDQVVVELAAKYGKTPAEVILRWHVEHGLCVDTGVRGGPDPSLLDRETHPYVVDNG